MPQAQKKANKENAVWRISPVATGDQRPTALDPCHLLKKVVENLHQADEIRSFRLQSAPPSDLLGGAFGL